MPKLEQFAIIDVLIDCMIWHFIGIANALDLTDRILPRLQARPKCKPQLLNFAPYSKDQIANIIKDRLKKVTQAPKWDFNFGGQMAINSKILWAKLNFSGQSKTNW